MKSQIHENKDIRLVVSRGKRQGRGRTGGTWSKHKLPVIRQISSRNVKYNTVAVANHTVQCVGKVNKNTEFSSKGKLLSFYLFFFSFFTARVPFFSCLQSFPASESFQISQLFASDGQSIRVSASISVLTKNTQNIIPLGWTSRISLQSKGLSRVFSNTTVQKQQFFSAQLSL